ncbi:cobalt-precorrin-6A reductase [Paraconexibacter antarcticus]|uniref:Cobalt-precorrin-6A reductase n=1 Tax=Paraconexibacter antarcticus TaxID=2949664 RepID=A0ABY5DQ06_9ACTN|nr:cobalt-precorrin-6A reductase [Paraconexibacter antarcticus]UTI64116.1 cobalt-precorrin-6A reductase [Paraconexibacter antarcticus]
MTPPADPAPGRVLILGGTAEARALAQALDDAGVAVVSSLAGRVARPRLPVGETRIGGFGGPEKLAAWLRDNAIAAVVDATHPFAERMSASAAQAAPAAGVPALRLARPGWTEQPGDRWTWVDDLHAANAALERLGAPRVLLTSGRQGLAAFAGNGDAWFLVRCVDPPAPEDLPPRHELLLDRGPYTLDGELGLVDAHGIEVVVTKDSGGPLTAAKLAAARARGLPVVVVRRPPRTGMPAVATVEEAVAWARARATGNTPASP